MTEYKISLIPGDGIGPELTEATLKVLDSAQKKFGLKLKIIEAEAGDDNLSQKRRRITRRHSCKKSKHPTLA